MSDSNLGATISSKYVDKSQVNKSVWERSDHPAAFVMFTCLTFCPFTIFISFSKVPPIEQKRMAAFINHFVVTTTEFLNEFIANVESKFIELETKLRFVESSLLIVESKVCERCDKN